MRYWLLLALSSGVLFGGGSAAQASTQLYGSGYKPWMDRCLKKSLVPTPETSIEIIPTDVLALSYIAPWPGGKLALSFSGNQQEDCQVLRHEIGHLFDWAVLSPSERSRVACRIFRVRTPVRWWSVLVDGQFLEGSEGNQGPLEWFAEGYRLAASVKSLPKGRDWQYRAPPSLYFGYGVDEVINRARLRKLRRLIRQAASRTADRQERDQRTPVYC